MTGEWKRSNFGSIDAPSI
jgi:dynein heavy chain